MILEGNVPVFNGIRKLVVDESVLNNFLIT